MGKLDKLLEKIDSRVGPNGVMLTRENWEEVKEAILSSKSALALLNGCDMNEAAIQLEELWGEE